MKYIITVELVTKDAEIIGAKEQIATALENIGGVKITDIKEVQK